MKRVRLVNEEKMVGDKFRARGFEADKCGYPDFQIIRDGEILGFVEAKPNGGDKLKPEQERFARFCRKHGIPFLMATPGTSDDVIDEFISSFR